MDTYASLQNQHGLRGTVVCTLGQGRILLPLGPQGALISVTGTQTGQGSWIRVEKNVYAFTAWRIVTDPEGKGVGWVKFWGESNAWRSRFNDSAELRARSRHRRRRRAESVSLSRRAIRT